jgi:hypothetical protein
MVNQVNQNPNKKVGRPTKREERIKAKLENVAPMERAKNLSLDQTKKVDGLVYRWFNDRDGRIQRAQAAGWEFVSNAGEMVENPESADEMEKMVGKRVGTQKDGAPLMAYLMAVEEEVYDHLQGLKQAKSDQIMEQIESRPALEEGMNPDDVYLKTADISVERGKPLKSM